MKKYFFLIGLAVFVMAAPVAADVDHGWGYIVGGDTLKTEYTYDDCTEGTKSLRVEIISLIGFAIVGTDSLNPEDPPDSVLIDLKPSQDCEFFVEITTTQDTVVTAPISVWGEVWNKNLKFFTAAPGSLVKVYLILQNYSTADSLVCFFDNFWFFKDNKWELWDGFPDKPSLGIGETAIKTLKFRIYPNPFRFGSANIEYLVIRDNHVTLKVYDIVGNPIKILVNERKSAGSYIASWNGKDDNEARLANGVYFYRLQAGDYTATKKVLFVK